MNIMVTGGAGLVGSALCEALTKAGHRVTAPTKQALDLTDRQATLAFCKQAKPDFVFHLAAHVGNIAENMKHPADFYFINSQLNNNVIDAAIQAGCQKLINLSSACVYPYQLATLAETDLGTGPLDPTRESYALAKLNGLFACKYASQQYHTHYKSVIACNLYGPNDRFNDDKAHFMPALIRKLHLAKTRDEQQVTIWGDGTPKRELMYVDDLVAFLIIGMNSITTLPDHINVGTGKDISIDAYYHAAAKVIGFNGRFTHDHAKPNGVKQRLLNVNLAHTYGWQAKTDLTTGIQKTYDAFLSHQHVEEKR